VIKRLGFTVMENRIKNNGCPACGALIHGKGL